MGCGSLTSSLAISLSRRPNLIEASDGVHALLADDALRLKIAESGRTRRFASGYTTADRGLEMTAAIKRAAAARRGQRKTTAILGER